MSRILLFLQLVSYKLLHISEQSELSQESLHCRQCSFPLYFITIYFMCTVWYVILHHGTLDSNMPQHRVGTQKHKKWCNSAELWEGTVLQGTLNRKNALVSLICHHRKKLKPLQWFSTVSQGALSLCSNHTGEIRRSGWMWTIYQGLLSQLQQF